MPAINATGVGQSRRLRFYVFALDRKAERPAAHLTQFKGVLHDNGYAGFERLTGAGTITLAAC